MKGIRGLLEKDFRLFFRQGSNLFLMLAFMALFFILTGNRSYLHCNVYSIRYGSIFREYDQL